MAGPSFATGPATNLLQSAVRLAGTLLEVVQTRGELVATEVEQEIGRAARVLLLGFAALLAAILGLLVLGVVIIAVFWDTHRVAAALAVLLVFAAIAFGSAWELARLLKTRHRFLAATRDELKRDIDRLRSSR